MSNMIQCDKCKKLMYPDSRSDKGDYCTIGINYVDGHTTLHLCKVCHRQFMTEFVRIDTPESYMDTFGAWWEEAKNECTD